MTNVCYNTLNEQRQKRTKLTLINVIWPDVHDFSMQLSLHGLNVANKKKMVYNRVYFPADCIISTSWTLTVYNIIMHYELA